MRRSDVVPNRVRMFVPAFSSKLSLYASLHTSIANHRGVLSEREAQLKSARENLIREGGNVVGSGGATGSQVTGGDVEPSINTA